MLRCRIGFAGGRHLFSPVYINDALTLDFQQTEEAYPIAHYCFRVSEQEFDAIVERLERAGVAYRSNLRGPVDMKINKDHGGSMIYWNEQDGHQWEILTAS